MTKNSPPSRNNGNNCYEKSTNNNRNAQQPGRPEVMSPGSDVPAEVSLGHVVARLDVRSSDSLFLEKGEVGGIFVAHAEGHPIGSEVTVELLLSWGETILLEAVIAWHRRVPRVSLRHKPGAGLRFLNLQPSQRAMFERATIFTAPSPIPDDAIFVQGDRYEL